MISHALREIGLKKVTDENLAEIMLAVDQITLTLQKIMRRKVREQGSRRRYSESSQPTTPAYQRCNGGDARGAAYA
jgi:hypothetical protein